MTDFSSRVVEPGPDAGPSGRTVPTIPPEQAQYAIESIAQGVLVTDAEWRLEYANAAFARMVGVPVEALIGRKTSDFVVDEDLQIHKKGQLERELGQVSLYELRLKRADGGELPVLITGVPRPQSTRFAGTIALVTDISERMRAERHLVRVNRALSVLKECNHALVHAVNEPDLLQKMCEIIVHSGGYRMAWVGFAMNDPGKSVSPVAEFGFEAGYLEQARVSWADTERGQGPTGLAIRTGEAKVNQDFLHNPAMAPWRAQAIERGYQSSTALPLRDQQSTFGALTIYAATPDAFDTEELQLLTELADDMAYGILALRDSVERRRVEDEFRRLCSDLEQRVRERTLELAESDARFRLALTHAPVAVATQDRDLRYTWAYNARSWQLADILGRTDDELFPPEDAARLIALKRRVLTTGDTLREQMWITSHAHRSFLDLFLEPIVDDQGGIVGIGLASVDLTNVKLAEQALRESESKYRTFFENLGETITILEAVRDDRGTLIDWTVQDANHVMLKATGRASEELIGRRFSEVFGGPELGQDLLRFRRALESGEASEHDAVIGERSFTVSVFRLDGTRVAAVGMDVTERKRAQEQMRAAVSDLTRFNRAMVGRELRMIELKREVNQLCRAAGQPTRYLLEGEGDLP